MNRILALDLGTHCGWAMLLDGRRISGLWDFASRRHEGGGMRFVRFRAELATLHPECVYYEEVVRHLGTAAAHIYGGMVAMLGAWCESAKVPYQGIHWATIKRHATGKGNANKEAMIAAARERLGYEGQSDDEADALWLLDFALTTYHEEPADAEADR